MTIGDSSIGTGSASIDDSSSGTGSVSIDDSSSGTSSASIDDSSSGKGSALIDDSSSGTGYGEWRVGLGRELQRRQTRRVAIFSICLRVLEAIEAVNEGVNLSGEIFRLDGYFGFSSGHELREQIQLLLQRGEHRVRGREIRGLRNQKNSVYGVSRRSSTVTAITTRQRNATTAIAMLRATTETRRRGKTSKAIKMAVANTTVRIAIFLRCVEKFDGMVSGHGTNVGLVLYDNFY